ncbi:MAG: hypothetical protein MUQ27_04235, partial [Acidimicrobiia bacterium]|nr:hypothetical protein [Acidimicrobiia bacterium]
LVELTSPLTPKRAALVASLVGAFALILALPPGRIFFDLLIPPLDILAVITAISVAGAIGLHVALRFVDHHGGKWVPWLRYDEEAQ